MRFSFELSQPPYGYLVLFDPARGFVLRLRRPPRVSLARPLEGLDHHRRSGTSARRRDRTDRVDRGGRCPTRGDEARAASSRQRGAHVVHDAHDAWTPSICTCAASSRAARTRTRSISIHLNAFGDGVNPFPNVGTSTLFFHPQSEPLARLVQAGMMREMGLRDLGIHYQNIAIGRTMWMPSIICEGAFLMVPEQENALKVAGIPGALRARRRRRRRSVLPHSFAQ